MTGEETFEIVIDDKLKPQAGCESESVGGRKTIEFATTCRIDTPVEIEYYRNGGILQTVLRKMLGNG